MVFESRNRQLSIEKVQERGESGYEVLLVKTLTERLTCPFCMKLMRNPIQTFRGELACEYCYQIHKT